MGCVNSKIKKTVETQTEEYYFNCLKINEELDFVCPQKINRKEPFYGDVPYDGKNAII